MDNNYFQRLLKEIEKYCSLKKMASDISISDKVSYKHLNNLKNGTRKEPNYTLGVLIVEYHDKIMKTNETALKERVIDIKKTMIKNWQEIN